MYELLLYAHVLAGVVWVGGAVTIQLLALRITRSDDPGELPRYARHLEALGTKVFAPAAVVILATGAVMTIQRFAFGQAWIAVAIVLWVVSAVAGAVYLGPRARTAATLFDEEGPTSVEGRRLLGRLFVVSRLELVSFAVIIGLMVFKPA